MGSDIIYFVIGVGLFAVSFVTKRRYGMLALALAAGSIISATWGYDFGLSIGAFGISTNSYTSVFASAVLLLLPSGILLGQGGKYKSLLGRVIGSVLFTILALAFLSVPLSNSFIPSGFGHSAYLWLVNNRSTIIALGLSLAVIELFLHKFTKSDKDKKHTKH